jgi:hypothetical protein
MTDHNTSVVLGDADYDAIQTAVMETARGRWFLAEFAKRNRTADTDKVLGAIEKLEGMMRNGRIVTGPDNLQAELVTLTARIAQAKMEIVAQASTSESHENMVKVAVKALHRVEGRVADIAEDLRRSVLQLDEHKAKLAAQPVLKPAPVEKTQLLAPIAPKQAVNPPVPTQPPAPKAETGLAFMVEEMARKVEAEKAARSNGEAEQDVANPPSAELEAIRIPSSRLSALEDLANRALSLKKTQQSDKPTSESSFNWPTVRRLEDDDAVKVDISAPRTPLMEPPAPVNDDRARPEPVQNFTPDWEVRAHDNTSEQEEELPVPQVAVAGQVRSAAAFSRSAPATAFSAGERTPFIAPTEQKWLNGGTRSVPFATQAASSKAVLATQAVAEKVREQVAALHKRPQEDKVEPAPAPVDAKDRFARHWEPAFRAVKPAAEQPDAPQGDVMRQQTARSAVSEEKPAEPQPGQSASDGAAGHGALRSAVTIRDIDALSFEEKAVYFA